MAVAIAVVAAMFSLSNSGDSTPAIYRIHVEQPYLVVEAAYLSKVELWFIPTGTGVTEAGYQKISEGELTGSDPKEVQRWRFQIPRNEFLATKVFAKGFDHQGTLIGTVELREEEASEIRDALFGTPVLHTDAAFSIMYPKTARLGDTKAPPLVTGEAVVRIDISSAYTRGTNLSEAAVLVGTSRDGVVTLVCESTSEGEAEGERRVFDGVSFTTFTHQGAAAGNRYETTSYRVLRSGTCYELQKFLHTTVLENYEPGMVRSFDKKAVDAELERIVETFRFR
jgi:hypothetical protein